MGLISNYYLDTGSFGTATAVYTDEALTVLAPDGWYATGGLVREQVGGVLQPVEPCPSCANPCATRPQPSAIGNQGLYTVQSQIGTGTGAVIIEYECQFGGPHGLRIIYNQEVYNEFSGALDGYHGAGQSNAPVYLGDSTKTCGVDLVTDSPYLNVNEYEYVGPLFQGTGLQTCISVLQQNVSLTDGFVGQPMYKAVVPKLTATPANITLEIYSVDNCVGPAATSIECPQKLTGFPSTKAGQACGTEPSLTLYNVPVNHSNFGDPQLYDWIFQDANGETKAVDGQYVYDDGATGRILSVSNGVVMSVALCPGWVGLLDIVGNAAGAWSTRRLSLQSEYLLRVRRNTTGAGDGDEADVAYDPATNFITFNSPIVPNNGTSTTIEQFVGYGGNPDGVPLAGLTLTVMTWYDQAGSNDFTAVDPSLEPLLYDFNDGSVDVKQANGKAAALFNDGAKMGPIDFNFPQPYTFSFVAKYDGATTVAQSNFFGSRTPTSGTNDIVSFCLRSSEWTMQAPFNGFGGIADTDQHQWVAIYDGVEYMFGGANGELIPSNSSLSTDGNVVVTQPGEIEIKNLSLGGIGVDAGSQEDRYMQELVCWTVNHEDERATIEANTSNEFNI